MEIISVCPKNKDQIIKTVEQVRLAMSEDIPLRERYNFPEGLKMTVGISAGDNWGSAKKIDAYLDSF